MTKTKALKSYLIFIGMIVPNIIHPEKRGKIYSSTFHVFYLTPSEATVYDKHMDIPIIYGNKNIINAVLKKFKDHLPMTTKRVRIFFYKFDTLGFKMKFKYDGLVDNIKIPLY